jgi:hypothetical protein
MILEDKVKQATMIEVAYNDAQMEVINLRNSKFGIHKLGKGGGNNLITNTANAKRWRHVIVA